MTKEHINEPFNPTKPNI